MNMNSTKLSILQTCTFAFNNEIVNDAIELHKLAIDSITARQNMLVYYHASITKYVEHLNIDSFYLSATKLIGTAANISLNEMSCAVSIFDTEAGQNFNETMINFTAFDVICMPRFKVKRNKLIITAIDIIQK